jgi:hypothetical protein
LNILSSIIALKIVEKSLNRNYGFYEEKVISIGVIKKQMTTQVPDLVSFSPASNYIP